MKNRPSRLNVKTRLTARRPYGCARRREPELAPATLIKRPGEVMSYFSGDGFDTATRATAEGGHGGTHTMPKAGWTHSLDFSFDEIPLLHVTSPSRCSPIRI